MMAYSPYVPSPPGGGSPQTIGQVFQSKGLWQWWTQNGGMGTNPYNGTTEKGIDYANSFGTPIGVPVGGMIVRMVHWNDSRGDIVEMQGPSGETYLYQHITAKVQVGQILNCGDVIGTENGLPIDQFSTGPHIEVRLCPAGQWSPNKDSWLEPWVNPFSLFSQFSNASAGGSGLPPGTSAGLFFGSKAGTPVVGPPVIKHLASNADVTAVLQLFDQACAVVNPFTAASAAAQVDTIAGLSVGPVNITPSISFSDPISWLTDFGTAFVLDITGLGIRLLLLFFGVVLIFKVVSGFVDFGKYFSDAQGIITKVATLAA